MDTSEETGAEGAIKDLIGLPEPVPGFSGQRVRGVNRPRVLSSDRFVPPFFWFLVFILVVFIVVATTVGIFQVADDNIIMKTIIFFFIIIINFLLI